MASGANLPLMHGLGGEPPVDADDADDVHDAKQRCGTYVHVVSAVPQNGGA